MSRWELDRRLDFIEDVLIDEGRINRAALCDYFGISLVQASSDLQRYSLINPQAMYDASAKAFRCRDDGLIDSVRGSTQARRKAWSVFRKVT